MKTQTRVQWDGLLLLASIAALYVCVHKASARDQTKSIEEVVQPEVEVDMLPGKVRIFYGTTTGTAKRFATTLEHHLKKKCPQLRVEVVDMKDYSDELLDKEDIALFILSTWEGGVPPPSCAVLLDTIDDMSRDFRVSKSHLANMRFSVFGLGTADYGPLYCKAAKVLDANLEEMGGQRLLPLATGDDAHNLEQAFYKWSSTAVKVVLDTVGFSEARKERKGPRSTVPAKKTINAAAVQAVDPAQTQASSGCGSGSCGPSCGPAGEEEEKIDVDIEDLINDTFVDADASGSLPISAIGVEPDARREMVTPLQRRALTKEGYKIIGTHSAVKLCRWTKHHLRGRGGCYKHSFYGITSYQCMEATPSLACANKCVFCWRHHKNPVGTEWRWKEDSPDMIVSEAIALHVSMIHGMKGVPGVLPERYQEAHTVRHCALSLVGEPIMYPRINEMLHELHRREISSFMVTNAQFPDRIDQLDPVTQLYISVDAATKDALKAIDRPLFKDFWERYLACLVAIRKKAQRTVFRMTLVKDWNMEELDGYAQLVEQGLPDFIEIKAVTYCGKSDASSLTMQNVPWHDDVCQYADRLCARLNERQLCGTIYSIATEHQHSCCLLIAREDKFKVDGQWHTWIDYPKFHALMREYYASGGQKTFKSEEYRAPTPAWAVYQSRERGFDPEEVRWRRGDKSTSEVDPTLVPDAHESGCG